MSQGKDHSGQWGHELGLESSWAELCWSQPSSEDPVVWTRLNDTVACPVQQDGRRKSGRSANPKGGDIKEIYLSMVESLGADPS